jgi:threonine/homoserine/homoserine lactone efflux protein
MAVRCLKSGTVSLSGTQTSKSYRRLIIDGILINILNPKLSIFFFAFIPQFVSFSTVGATALMMQLSLMFMLITFIVFCFYAVSASMVRGFIVERPLLLKRINRCFAAIFAMLAVKLGISS